MQSKSVRVLDKYRKVATLLANAKNNGSGKLKYKTASAIKAGNERVAEKTEI